MNEIMRMNPGCYSHKWGMIQSLYIGFKKKNPITSVTGFFIPPDTFYLARLYCEPNELFDFYPRFLVQYELCFDEDLESCFC